MGEVTQIAEALGAVLAAPTPLSKDHDVAKFSCGVPPLDDWLKNRALKAEGLTARTYVVCVGRQVVAYYSLATGAIVRAELPKRMQRNAPDNIPVMILTRLAVDTRCREQGIGKGLLKEAMLRALQVSEIVGVRALLIHAKDEIAGSFYKKYGFIESPLGALTFILPIETIAASL